MNRPLVLAIFFPEQRACSQAMFGKDGTQREQLYQVFIKKKKENNEKDILSRCFSNLGQLTAIRGTQGLFSVQHLFGEANIA